MNIVAIVPTLNEVDNIKKLFKKLNNLKIKLTILFIDDDSNDGTRNVILRLSKKYKNLKYIFRNKRLGIGSAHKCGFKWAFKNQFNLCVTLDGDMTHNPILIKKMLTVLNRKKCHIVSTSRFKLKKSIEDWPILRIVITKIRYNLVRYLLNTNLDSSGGFRLYDLQKIKLKHLILSKNNSYFFLIESLFFLQKFDYKIYEIPIHLPFRVYGSSKMRFNDIFLSFWNLIKLKFYNF